MVRAFLILTLVVFSQYLYSQGCCSGGSGSPIAGGASQGVLAEKQLELSSSFQYINTHQFKAKDRDTSALFDNYNSKYLYTKIGYGLTKEFTFSVEAGYFFNKTQIGLNRIDTNRSSGIADLIIFPRYNIYNKSDSSKRVELTVGLGYKIPLGKHNDSVLVYHNPITGQNVYTTMPPLVQPTTGSQDFIFYAFFLRSFPKHNFRLFANGLYIRKGWNSLGEKFGDYKSIGLFAGKTFFNKLGLMLQVRGEIVDKMKADRNVDLLAFYNVDINSTGNKRVMVVPQVTYNINRSLTLYGLYEHPLYEYVNGAQVAAQTQFTVGFSYRFFVTKKAVCTNPFAEVYECPMKCEGMTYEKRGKCKMCGMELIKK